MVKRRDLWDLLIQRHGKDGLPLSPRYVDNVESCIFALFNYDEQGAPEGVKVKFQINSNHEHLLLDCKR